MTRKNLIAGAIIAAFFAVTGLVAARTFGTRGQDAIERMSADERAVLAKLQSLRRGMSFAQVAEIMGLPDEIGPLAMRPKWFIGGSQLNAVVVYILPGGAHRFTWISIGRFTYNEELRAGDRAAPIGGHPERVRPQLAFMQPDNASHTAR